MRSQVLQTTKNVSLVNRARINWLAVKCNLVGEVPIRHRILGPNGMGDVRIKADFILLR